MPDTLRDSLLLSAGVSSYRCYAFPRKMIALLSLLIGCIFVAELSLEGGSRFFDEPGISMAWQHLQAGRAGHLLPIPMMRQPLEIRQVLPRSMAASDDPSPTAVDAAQAAARTADVMRRREFMALSAAGMVSLPSWQALADAPPLLPPGYDRGGGVPDKMSAVVCSKTLGEPPFGDAARTAIALRNDVMVPSPGMGQVLVKVLATSVNPIDWKVLTGSMPFPVELPTAIGFDLAGIVEKVGPDVSAFSPGDAVWGELLELNPAKTTIMGAYAQYAVVETSKLGRAPSSLPPEEAASVPLVGMTALQGIRDALGLAGKKGSKVLILGGSGGVGTLAVQIAKDFGLQVTTTCGTRNVELLKRLGANDVLDYTKEPWDKVLKPKSFDGVFDCVGEDGVQARANVVLKDKGKFASIANFADYSKEWKRGVTGGPFGVKSNSKDLDVLKDLVEGKKLVPVVQSVAPLERAPELLIENTQGRVVGKLAIKVQ